MPPRDTQFADSFAYDGILDWPSAIWVFVGLAALVGWLMWRERKITGPGKAAFFFVLRLAAIAVVLWMLLGPTHVATERTTIPQTLAIVVDSSQSMDVAEPMPKVERLRWLQAIERDLQPHLELGQSDAAVVTLQFAIAHIRQATSAIEEYAPTDEVTKRLEAAKKGVEKAEEHFTSIAKILKSADEELSRRAAEIADELHRDALAALDKVSAAQKRAASAEAASPLQELTDDFDRWLRRAESLQRSIVIRIENSADSAADSNPTSLSRKELLAKALNRIEADVLSRLSSKVNIKRVRVDEFASPLTGNQPWSAALNATQATPAVDSPPADGLGSATKSGGGGLTNLSAAIELLGQDAAAESIVAAVLWSDGGHNAQAATEPRVAAAGLVGLALHVVPVGSQEPRRDLLVNRVEAPSSVILNDKIVLEALVTGQHVSGEQATVELRRAGQLIDERKLTFDSDRQDHRVRFTMPADELGQQVFDFSITPLADEISSTNNSAVVTVRVVRDTTRILLADRISRWEYRYLDQLFRRDKHVEFDKLLYAPNRLGTGRLEATKELPRDVDGWAQYDVVILGDLEPATFDIVQQQSLAEWVQKRGGNLVVIAGREFMPHQFGRSPLAALLPVQEQPRMLLDQNGYLPAFTHEGARHEALLFADNQVANADLWAEQFRSVPIFFLSSVCVPKPAAHVLLEASPASDFVRLADDSDRAVERALLAWQDVGAGRVVYLASPVSYHLRFRRGDELHHRFWGQMLRWLTAPHRGKGRSQLFVKTAQSRYEYGQPIEVTVTLAGEDGGPISGAQLSAVAEPPTGQPVTVPLTADENVPGRYLGKFDKLQAGAYRISATGEQVPAISASNPTNEDATALVTVFAPDNIEMHDTRGNRALLREVAEVTGGQVLPPTAIGELLELSASAPRVIENSERTPLWNRWRYFWIVIGCLVTEWGVRRWIGLV